MTKDLPQDLILSAVLRMATKVIEVVENNGLGMAGVEDEVDVEQTTWHLIATYDSGRIILQGHPHVTAAELEEQGVPEIFQALGIGSDDDGSFEYSLPAEWCKRISVNDINASL